ncbi:MAG: hypothetical protein AABW80_03895 [Nanoarchaeota archaeon]
MDTFEGKNSKNKVYLKINRKGLSDIAYDVLLGIIIAVIFVVPVMLHINSLANGERLWSEYYSGEIAKLINNANSGDELQIDSSKAMEIARKNRIESHKDVFFFSNEANKICVKMDIESEPKCRFYFKDLNVVDVRSDVSESGNLLRFKIVEADRGGVG